MEVWREGGERGGERGEEREGRGRGGGGGREFLFGGSVSFMKDGIKCDE